MSSRILWEEGLWEEGEYCWGIRLLSFAITYSVETYEKELNAGKLTLEEKKLWMEQIEIDDKRECKRLFTAIPFDPLSSNATKSFRNQIALIVF